LGELSRRTPLKAFYHYHHIIIIVIISVHEHISKELLLPPERQKAKQGNSLL